MVRHDPGRGFGQKGWTEMTVPAFEKRVLDEEILSAAA
jgi:hypothetical protein